MVPGVKPVMLLVNEPVPVPSVVFDPVIVGFADVPQHTPLAVIADPPSDVILPPEVKDDDVIADAAVVVRTGATAVVVNCV